MKVSTEERTMKKMTNHLKTIASIALAVGIPLPGVAAPSHKSIPLDGGGYFSGITAHAAGRIYGYGDTFGAFRSDNSGQTWKYLNGDIPTDENFVSGMDVSTGNPDLVAFRSPGKLVLSTDGGATWSTPLRDLANVQLVRGASPVMFHPRDDKDLWLAASRKEMSGSLWRSPDGGATWTKVGGATFDKEMAITIYVRPEFPDQVWVGTDRGLHVSTDRGATWNRVWNNDGAINPWNKQPPSAHAIVRRKDGVAYVATNVGGYRVTADDWKNPATYTFTKTVSWWGGWGPVNATVLADDSFVTGGIGGDRDPNNPDSLQSAQRISKDGGQTWTYLPMNFSMPPQPVWSPAPKEGQKTNYGHDFIVQDPKIPTRWYVTGGLLPAISTDSGQNWKYPNNSGIAAVMTYKVNFTRRNPNMALIPGGDLCAFVVTDGGTSGNASASSFRTVNKLTSCHEIMSSDDGKILVAAGTDQVANKSMIMRSTDSGATWAELDLTNSGLPDSSEGITRSAMMPGDPNDFLVLIAGEGNGTTPRLYRTTNGGKNFTAVGVGIIPNSMDTGHRYHPEHSFLLVDVAEPNTRYLSVRPYHHFKSTDKGATWSKMTSPWSNARIDDLAVDRAKSGKLWAAGSWAGIKTSGDGGATWVEVPGFREARAVDAANGQVAVWGQRDGDTHYKLYWSPDNGQTWTEATGKGHRYALTRGISVDPWVKGKVWISGISANVISGLPEAK